MTVTDLDDAYDNRGHIAGADDYPPRWMKEAEEFRQSLQEHGRADLGISYGSHERNKLDLFLPDVAPEGLFCFVHGGYWKAFDRSVWSHFASGALARGFAVAMPSYVLAPEARISEITQQIRAAIEKAAGLVAGPIRLAGHSAGGHLVSRMLCADMTWTSCFVERIEKVVSISGLHDLRPLLRTSMNDILGLTEDEAAAESAILHADHLPVPVTAWVGGAERPAFIDQSEWLARDWDNASVVIDPGKHHFDVIDGLREAESPLSEAVFGD